MTLAASPLLDVGIKCLPPTQIEIANAEVAMVRNVEGFLQCRKKFVFYVVEDAWHSLALDLVLVIDNRQFFRHVANS